MLIGWVAALCLISTHTVWKAERKKHSGMVQRPALPVLKGAASFGNIGPGDCAGLGRRQGTQAPLLRLRRFSLILKRCWWCQTVMARTPANSISQKRGLGERAQLMSTEGRARTWAIYNLPPAHVPVLERACESSQGHEGRNTSVGGSQRKRATKKGSGKPKRKASCCCLGGDGGQR